MRPEHGGYRRVRVQDVDNLLDGGGPHRDVGIHEEQDVAAARLAPKFLAALPRVKAGAGDDARAESASDRTAPVMGPIVDDEDFCEFRTGLKQRREARFKGAGAVVDWNDDGNPGFRLYRFGFRFAPIAERSVSKTWCETALCRSTAVDCVIGCIAETTNDVYLSSTGSAGSCAALPSATGARDPSAGSPPLPLTARLRRGRISYPLISFNVVGLMCKSSAARFCAAGGVRRGLDELLLEIGDHVLERDALGRNDELRHLEVGRLAHVIGHQIDADARARREHHRALDDVLEFP